MKSRAKVEFGDFQTPLSLASEVCALLHRLGVNPDVVIEPTVGRGAFIEAAAEAFPNAQLRGWDINPEYVRHAEDRLRLKTAAGRAVLGVQDFFTHDWEGALGDATHSLLLLGNPPWVTNSGVSVVNGTNLPAKENFMGLRGIAARTGKANFDISEWMLIRLLRALGRRSATLAMLCKTSTARKFLRYGWQNDGRICHAALYRIDAAKHFDATVDACLLLLETGAVGPNEADIFKTLSATEPAARLGLVGKELVSDLEAYRELAHLDGLCPFQWRSGVKHDCAAVLELRPKADGKGENGLEETVTLEFNYVFPLLKCSDLANDRVEPRRAVIVPQRFVGDDTSVIAALAPQTWSYLHRHLDRFQARKSSIYKAGMPFALFGIGNYAFAAWKVAVSALHRSAHFCAIGPKAGQPVFFDDASYYLSFEHEADARLVAEILNSEVCQRFLSALVFTDSKRPLTVDLLQRLDLAAIASASDRAPLWAEFQRRRHVEPTQPQQLALVMEEPPELSRSICDSRTVTTATVSPVAVKISKV